MQVIIISGLSGSGKSVALKVLEDAGYYCVDNLPGRFIPSVVEYLTGLGHQKVSLSIDARSGKAMGNFVHVVNDLRAKGMDVRILFLEAKTDSLVKRFSETRRPHPLAGEGRSLAECIELERETLAEIAELAHRIDTSDLRPNALRGWVKTFVALDQSRFTVFLQSFGFKNGIPSDADYVFDVRCLPNPYYDPVMRPLTGNDAAVITFLDANLDAQAMLDDIRQFLTDWLPSFVRDSRASLNVAFGCTGGQHRSVYFANKLAAQLGAQYQVFVRHRELAD